MRRYTFINLTDDQLLSIADRFYEEGGFNAKRIPNRFNIPTEDIREFFLDFLDYEHFQIQSNALGDDEVCDIREFRKYYSLESVF